MAAQVDVEVVVVPVVIPAGMYVGGVLYTFVYGGDYNYVLIGLAVVSV